MAFKQGDYWLHEGENGFYYFSHEQSGSVNKPTGWKVKKTRTGMPVLTKQ